MNQKLSSRVLAFTTTVLPRNRSYTAINPRRLSHGASNCPFHSHHRSNILTIPTKRTFFTNLKGMVSTDNQESSNDMIQSKTSGAASSSDNGTTTSENIEVEKKFHMSSSLHDMKSLQSSLMNMGFVPSSKIQFMDWYFDIPPPNMTLCIQDCWLRYRCLVPSSAVGMSDGDNENDDKMSSWELKKARVVPKSTTTTNNAQLNNNKSVTIYQEVTGQDAIQEVVNIFKKIAGRIELCSNKESNKDEFHIDNGTSNKDIIQPMEGPNIPPSLQSFGIQPFARIQTTRYQWKMMDIDAKEGMTTNNQRWNGTGTIKVDMDVTDFGYAVGEVEVVVSSMDQVNHAKEVVEDIVSRIMSASQTTDDNNASDEREDKDNKAIVVMGKLETYLLRNQPHVYSVCVNAGVMKKR